MSKIDSEKLTEYIDTECKKKLDGIWLNMSEYDDNGFVFFIKRESDGMESKIRSDYSGNFFGRLPSFTEDAKAICSMIINQIASELDHEQQVKSMVEKIKPIHNKYFYEALRIIEEENKASN